MRVALVYDWINKWGGAERVLSMLHDLYPDAPIYTLVYNSETAMWANKIKVIPSFFNKLKSFRSRHEYLPLFASMAFESFTFDNYDVVISVTSAQAKSILTKPQTLHICYCLAPTRYLWTSKVYDNDPNRKFLLPFIKKYLCLTDRIYAQRPDVYLATSREISNRIKLYYSRDSQIIYPSIDDKFYVQTDVKRDDFYLVVSRLVAYKKIDLVIKTFNQLNKRLVVVGVGNHEKHLKKIASKNIEFVGLKSDPELITMYRKSKAVIYPQLEDFGLVPLEAQANGTPVIAYAGGGALETVKHKTTGILFSHQTETSLTNAIRLFESGEHQITAQKCRQNAALYTKNRFIKQFSAKVESLWKQHQRIFM